MGSRKARFDPARRSGPEYRLTPEEAEWLEHEYSEAVAHTMLFERTPPCEAEQEMLKFFFAELPPDVGALAAYKVAVLAVHQARRKLDYSANYISLVELPRICGHDCAHCS
jgi:hypothetical protein